MTVLCKMALNADVQNADVQNVMYWEKQWEAIYNKNLCINHLEKKYFKATMDSSLRTSALCSIATKSKKHPDILY